MADINGGKYTYANKGGEVSESEHPAYDEHKEKLAGFDEFTNANPTQEDLVLHWLTNIGTLTQRDAIINLSVGRLAARVYTLIHKYGHPINKNMITVKNQFGKKCSVAEYYLDSEEIEYRGDTYGED